MTTTTQRAAAATTTTHRRRFIVHPQQQQQQTSTASDDTTGSSNDDYDDTIDGDSGTAITRRATAVTRMRWRGVLASASTCGSDGYSRREYECQLGKLGEYSLSRVLAAASTSRVRLCARGIFEDAPWVVVFEDAGLGEVPALDFSAPAWK
ncbi:hypothetical protein EDB89DRAFT_1906818 [Lactarius sanguifluus]|nr:hypothetical protein EDB89DRAFT_1906818 [Lactarius sanguifluus]